MHRVNYGNGQVGPQRKHKRDVVLDVQHARKYSGLPFVERYQPGSADEPGEWVKVDGADLWNRHTGYK